MVNLLLPQQYIYPPRLIGDPDACQTILQVHTMTQENADRMMAISLKLPPFWTQQPRIWFVQAEAQLATKRIIADEVKYNYVVAALDQEVATRVLDLIESPPEEDKYDSLKRRLIETYALSEYERAGQILHAPEMGDAKPSELLDKMLGYLGSEKPCFLFRRIFLERLPDEVRTPLMHMDIKDIRALAQAADRLWESKSNAAFAVQKFKKSYKSKDLDPELCYYHGTYGNRAFKCKPPCKMAHLPLAGNAKADHQ